MALYILDDLFRRKTMVEKFEELVWTERFRAFGDFVLKLQSTSEFRTLLPEGTRLAVEGSTRVMEVQTVEDTVDEEGRAILKITGYSLEALLQDRVCQPEILPTLPPDAEEGAEVPKWTITGLPAEVARYLFDKICRETVIDVGDAIPLLVNTPLYSTGTLAEPSETVIVELEIDTLYNTIQKICNDYDLGFRLVRGPETGTLHFDIYAGNDRTSSQSSVAAVVFSPDLDNLTKVTQLSSKALYKNVAVVIHKDIRVNVYANDISPSIAGFERKVLLVKVDQVPEFTKDPVADRPFIEAFLQKKGLEELAKNRRVTAFDGEIPQNGKYQYEKEYLLGDMVEMRTTDGVAKNMRVSEQIFVFDKEGRRTYPTLTDILFITPGSWFAWDYNQVWEEATKEWQDA